MTIPNRDYLILLAEMAASIAGGKWTSCPDVLEAQDDRIAHLSIAEAVLVLNDLDIHPATPITF